MGVEAIGGSARRTRQRGPQVAAIYAAHLPDPPFRKKAVARYRGKFKHRYFRADAAFANPEVYEFLEAEGFNARSGCMPIRFSKRGSGICLSDQSVALPSRSADTTPASAIRRKAGRRASGRS